MGIVYYDEKEMSCIIRSEFIFYGDAASDEIAIQTAADIQTYWNSPEAVVRLRGRDTRVQFHVAGRYVRDLTPDEVWYNEDAVKNFFRVESYCNLDVSFVDGIGCNTGYFKLANLLQTPTTAAHEYGHTLGLDHPVDLDIRGFGVPGIMYPRGTVTDPQYLYNPLAIPGDNTNGGTMNPIYRQVTGNDIQALLLHRLSFDENGYAILGDLSSIWHDKHLPG